MGLLVVYEGMVESPAHTPATEGELQLPSVKCLYELEEDIWESHMPIDPAQLQISCVSAVPAKLYVSCVSRDPTQPPSPTSSKASQSVGPATAGSTAPPLSIQLYALDLPVTSFT